MPHLSAQVTPWGPLLNVFIAVSAPRAAALQAANQTLPAPVVAKLVVDTGASHTAIDTTILQALQLQPTGNTQIHTPSTQGAPHSVNLYDVALLIPGSLSNLMVHAIPAMPVIDGSFKPQGIDGLLGRDVIASSILVYSGAEQAFFMSF